MSKERKNRAKRLQSMRIHVCGDLVQAEEHHGDGSDMKVGRSDFSSWARKRMRAFRYKRDK